ncbi:MAG: hypothetical protein ACI4IF_04495 [Acutalibacteraceae bacterium]
MKTSKIFVVIIAILLVASLCSCNNYNKPAEVDFTEPKSVQISYNGLILNATVSFNDNTMHFVYDDNNTSVIINSDFYDIEYMNLTYNGTTEEIPENFLPLIVYKFFYSHGSSFIIEKYNKETSSYILQESISDCFFDFECFVNGENKTYSITIK